MKHNIIIALVAAAALSAPAANAQNTRNITLDEAIQLSLKNSGQLKFAMAKAMEAKAEYKEAKNNHLPDVKVTGAYMRLNKPDIKMAGSGSDTGTSKSGNFSVDQVAYGMVNASLPIFSGLRIRYGVESAKYLEKAALMDAEYNKEDVIQNTINAYSNLYKAKRSVDLIEENLRQQKQRVTDFGNLEKNGLLARNDLLKAQLQQSTIELSLLEAQNNLKITNINVNLMLGLPEETDLVPDTTGFTYPADAGSILQWEQTALQNRKDISSLGWKEKAAMSAIKSTRGEYYPSLALTGGYIAADVPGLLTVTNALNIGLGLQYNIGAIWKTGAKVEQQKARLYQVQISKGRLSDQVRLEINQSYNNYLLSLKKTEVYARAIEQANENYRITKNKYDNNLVNTTELLEADVAQLQAKLNFMFSKIDALVTYKKLQQTAGTLSDK